MFDWLFGSKPKSMITRPQLKRVDRNSIPKRGNQQRDWKATTDSDSSLNHWGKANGQSINTVLALNLNKIISRSVFESRANPIVDGTINSHANDVVGSNGPKIQFKTDSDRWNDKAKVICNEVFKSIDGSGELSLADYLKQGVRSLWTTGAILNQYVDDPACGTVVKQRLHPIPVQSLYSHLRNDADTMLGITRNKLGRATKYWVVESGVEISSLYYKINPIEIPARDIQHVFYKHETQQWRGYPWLASSLQALAELDEYDTAVLDAAKIAAMMAVLFFNTRDDVDSEENPSNFEIARQSGVKVPTGWQPYALNANQPTATHAEFKADKIRDIGRPIGMPLMAIQRDASKHTFSSAHYDGQGYARANESIQVFLSTGSIDPFVSLILTEAMLRGVLPYKNLAGIEAWSWIWPQPPSVDPVKKAMAQRLELENKTISPQRACLQNNVDFETLCQEWKKANEILKANGLPEMLGPIPADPMALANALKQYENEQNNEGDTNDDNIDD
jgi:capsid protein